MLQNELIRNLLENIWKNNSVLVLNTLIITLHINYTNILCILLFMYKERSHCCRFIDILLIKAI